MPTLFKHGMNPDMEVYRVALRMDTSLTTFARYKATLFQSLPSPSADSTGAFTAISAQPPAPPPAGFSTAANCPINPTLHNSSPSGSGQWSEMGGAVKSGTSPAAFVITNGRTFVVAVGTDARLWWTKSDSSGNKWGSWTGSLRTPGESIRGSPALAALDSQLFVFVVGDSGKLYYMIMDHKDGSNGVETWQHVGNTNCTSDMAATGMFWNMPSSTCVTAMRYGTDDMMWHTYVALTAGIADG
eukprot:jgi/Tetstr1/435211/TSEL_024130.t1